ncbi:MAG TPA: hypothetical protein VGX78_19990 [Pirellulales bacterium]|jgi:hypothetical protein|nr:hypothetical protein [Pirellulales bacterium]
MIMFRITTDVKADRRVVLNLPPEVPTGQTELVVTVEYDPSQNVTAGTSLMDWMEVLTGCEVKDHAQSSLRGNVDRYDQPTEPVAESDWEGLR